MRNKSDLRIISAPRDVLRKIGLRFRKNVSSRFSGAKNDPTFLLADVELVAAYDH